MSEKIKEHGMELKITHASDEEPSEPTWNCETVKELLDKIRECGRDVIIDKNGNVIIYDGRVE